MNDKLRDEIVESEKARNDLLKWKLVLVAALGAGGLGIGITTPNVIVLALIPFVCLYVDALCFHGEIRILAIAGFLRTLPETDYWRQYEDYCKRNRHHFSLESFALVGTTVGLSAGIFLCGFSPTIQRALSLPVAQPSASVLEWTGLGGAIAGVWFYLYFSHKRKAIDQGD